MPIVGNLQSYAYIPTLPEKFAVRGKPDDACYDPEVRAAAEKNLSQLVMYDVMSYFEDMEDADKKRQLGLPVDPGEYDRKFKEKGYKLVPDYTQNPEKEKPGTYWLEIYGVEGGYDVGPEGNLLSEAEILGLRAQALQIGKPWAPSIFEEYEN